MIDWDSRETWLKLIPHKSQVRFALFCVRQVSALWECDAPSVNTILLIEKWLEGKATQKECRAAAYYSIYSVVYNAAYIVDVDYDPSIVLSVNIAANSATHASKDVFHFSNDSAESQKQEQVEYLRELYLETLPEEHRNSWLVQACL